MSVMEWYSCKETQLFDINSMALNGQDNSVEIEPVVLTHLLEVGNIVFCTQHNTARECHVEGHGMTRKTAEWFKVLD